MKVCAVSKIATPVNLALANVPLAMLEALVVSVVAEVASPCDAIEVTAPLSFDVAIAALPLISVLINPPALE